MARRTYVRFIGLIIAFAVYAFAVYLLGYVAIHFIRKFW